MKSLDYDELMYNEALLLAIALGLIDQPAEDWRNSASDHGAANAVT